MRKLFVKGLIFGCGLLLPLTIVSSAVYASQIIPLNSQPIGSYDVVPNGYAFTWLVNDETCQQISTRLGVKVNQMQNGEIITGYKPSGQPVYKQGIVIVFDKLPTSVITDKLDYEAGIKGFQRTGGKSIVDTLQKVDASVIK